MKINRVASQINRYRAASLLIHIGVMVAIGLLVRHISMVKIAMLSPQTRAVQHLVLSLPGSVEAGSPKAAVKSIVKRRSDHGAQTLPAPPHFGRPSPTRQTGEGISGHSAWGKGEITIAYNKYFPYPTPDLSTMRAGTEGDVILTALIDEKGTVSQLTLLTGINPAINLSVIQTVRQWTFTPATKDGLPISSRQEIHFHFRSSLDV